MLKHWFFLGHVSRAFRMYLFVPVYWVSLVYFDSYVQITLLKGYVPPAPAAQVEIDDVCEYCERVHKGRTE